MSGIERIFIEFLLNFMSIEQLNAFMRDPRTVAIIVGSLVSASGALLGTFLLLRKMSLTSDAISHTVLLGIVVAFMVMTGLLGMDADLGSPLLILGAAGAGILTVILTEVIERSGLVKEDAALGLAFPLLFAIAVILISRYVDNVHLDSDTVLVGEIGVAWANTNSICFENCEDVIITPDHPSARMGQRCVNCAAENINPRNPAAISESYCVNCGTYSAASAFSQRLITESPLLVFWPRSITVMSLITLVVAAFVALFYKELKLSTFDSALAKALGFKPGWIHYGLMILVSLTAVGAFDAVGSILVIAFFIIPPAAAYLLTDRLSWMLFIAPGIGILGAITGYEFARGSLFGIIQMNDILRYLDGVIGLDGYVNWNVSISASMVITTFILFLLCWVLSPRYGLVSNLLRRRQQRRTFADQLLLGHVYNHQGTPSAAEELHTDTLHEHLGWSPRRVQFVLTRLRLQNLVQIRDHMVELTNRGVESVRDFQIENLHTMKTDDNLRPGLGLGD